MDFWLFLAAGLQLLTLGIHAHLVHQHDDEDRGLITMLLLSQLLLLFMIGAVYFATAWPIGAAFGSEAAR